MLEFERYEVTARLCFSQEDPECRASRISECRVYLQATSGCVEDYTERNEKYGSIDVHACTRHMIKSRQGLLARDE